MKPDGWDLMVRRRDRLLAHPKTPPEPMRERVWFGPDGRRGTIADVLGWPSPPPPAQTLAASKRTEKLRNRRARAALRRKGQLPPDQPWWRLACL